MTTTSSAAPAPAQARRHLLSWVRDGLAGKLTETDPGSGPVRARASLATGLTVNGAAVAGPKLALHGPGDVVGIDPRQVIRTDPAPAATAFEATHLALVEFDDPGLPWRLTPVAPHPQKGLRPWLVLVVVDTDAPGVRLTTTLGGARPVLETPAGELPDLAHSAAWAHAEVVAADGEDLATILASQPERTVSRLIAARALGDGRRYLACVVPAFEHGRLAGLGLAVPDTETTAPAWTGSTGTVRLPVYHHWTFATAPGGDFTTLAERLAPAVADAGFRELSYRDADPETTRAIGTDPGVLGLLPALTAPGVHTTDEPHPGFVTAMGTILGRAATSITPPIYLGPHIGHAPGWTGTEPLWLRQLNTDPRLRAAAGLGAEVVRIHQEALMSAAWAQAAELAQANRELSQGQVGRAVSESLHRRHFDPAAASAQAAVRTAALTAGLTPDAARAAAAAVAADQADAVLERTARSLRRIPAGTGTMAGEVATHEPTAAVSSADVVRAARPTGPAARAGGATVAQPLASALGPVAAGTIVPAPPLQAGRDAGVLDRYVGGTIRYRDIDATLVESAPQWWHNPHAGPLPLVTPGPLGYLTDLAVIQERSDRTGATLTLNRSIDFDGRSKDPGYQFTIPPDPAAPTVSLVGAVVHRAGPGWPTTLLAGLRRGVSVDTWDPCVRSVRPGNPTYPTSTPYTVLPYVTASALRGADVTLRRRAGQPDAAAELVVLWTSAEAGGDLGTRSYQLDSGAALGPQRKLPVFLGGADVSSIGIDLVPITVPAGQPYAEPTDIVVGVLSATFTTDWSTQYVYPVWRLDWHVGRNFGTPAESWVKGIGFDLALRVRDDTTSGRLSISVSDLDGDGDPELVTHLTFTEELTGGGTRRVTRQRVAYGLHPDATIEHWEAPIDLPVNPLAPDATTITVLGDFDDLRLDRIVGVGDAFRQIAMRHQARLIRPQTRAEPAAGAASYRVEDVAAEVSAAVNPTTTIPAAVTDRLSALPSAGASLATAGPVDPLRPRLYDPSFPQPMAEPLRELFPDLAFPAVDALPDNSVALMVGNGPLIAAYLAGVNHEFARELLWRGFPTSGRATWFRRFFDAAGSDPGVADIAEIADWGHSGDLGGKATGPASDGSVILLVRGELLRRYPNVVVQAARAVTTTQGRQPDSAVVLPTFTGRVGADVTLFSFAIPASQIRGGGGDPGWFFIFAQPPTEPRFGGAADWNQPGAHAAAALLKLPFRVAVHASDLLASTTPTPGA